MPTLWKLTLALGFGGLMLATPQAGFAVDFYVNACCLSTAPVSGGGERKTVSSHVGSDRPHNATVRMTFKVRGSNGFVCQKTVEATGPFVNALTMPVHFRVTYPPPPAKPLAGALTRGTVYTVEAVINNITPSPPPQPPPADVSTNNAHQASYTLPSGGTPECVSSPGPN